MRVNKNNATHRRNRAERQSYFDGRRRTAIEAGSHGAAESALPAHSSLRRRRRSLIPTQRRRGGYRGTHRLYRYLLNAQLADTLVVNWHRKGTNEPVASTATFPNPVMRPSGSMVTGDTPRSTVLAIVSAVLILTRCLLRCSVLRRLNCMLRATFAVLSLPSRSNRAIIILY